MMFIRRAALCAAAVLVMAACGSSDGGGGSASPAPGGPADSIGVSTPPDDSNDSGISSPSDEWDAVVAAAEDEPKLIVYSVHGPERLQNLAAAFSAAYPGIEVEAIRLSDADLVTTVDSELATGNVKASLWVSTQLEWVEGISESGILREPSGPMFEDGSPYDFERYVRNGDIIEVGAAVLTFAWNTDLHPQGIDDYEDLLDPALAGGRIGTIDAGLSSTQVDFYLWLERNFGEQYVEDLAAQNPRIYPSALPTNEALIAGEIYATPYASPYGLAEARDLGAPVEFGVSPTAGAWGAKHLAMLPEDAASPNAALVFLNFMLSPEGQAESQAVTSAVLDDVPTALLTNANVDDLDREGQQPENIAAYTERWTSLFQ